MHNFKKIVLLKDGKITEYKNPLDLVYETGLKLEDILLANKGKKKPIKSEGGYTVFDIKGNLVGFQYYPQNIRGRKKGNEWQFVLVPETWSQYHQRKRSNILNIFTTEDLQNVLKISPKQAKALMRTDGFTSIKIGREYRVEEQALLDWIGTTKAVKLDYTSC